MTRDQRSFYLSLVAAALLAGLVFQMGRRSGLDQGELAPEFSLPIGYQLGSESEARVRLSDYRGQVVVLDFWAGWCGPCRASVPDMNRVARAFQDRGVAFFGINSEAREPAQVATVAQSWRFAYPVLLDGAGEAEHAYQVHAYPTVFVIDRQGRVAASYAGAPEASELTEQLHRLVK